MPLSVYVFALYSLYDHWSEKKLTWNETLRESSAPSMVHFHRWSALLTSRGIILVTQAFHWPSLQTKAEKLRLACGRFAPQNAECRTSAAKEEPKENRCSHQDPG